MALGVSKVPFKMSVDLMIRCARWAQKESSYQDAEKVMREDFHID